MFSARNAAMYSAQLKHEQKKRQADRQADRQAESEWQELFGERRAAADRRLLEELERAIPAKPHYGGPEGATAAARIAKAFGRPMT